MSAIAIIPARSGSKRIPGKNIKMFFGKPIIAYSIRAAKESDLFEKIIVSTDSEEIAKVASDWGAEVPFIRPAELSGDVVTTDSVVLHALQWIKENIKVFKYACCIYATAPLIRQNDLKKGFDLLVENNAVSAFSVAEFAYPIFRALKINDKGNAVMFWPEYYNTFSQDLPAAYHDAGQFYCIHVEKNLQEKRLFSSHSIPVVLPAYRVQDIDILDDWEMAERKYKAMMEDKKPLL